MPLSPEELSLAYPIGKFQAPDAPSPETVLGYIDAIAAAPGLLEAAVHGLADAQLDTPYRPGGWTLRQVVHHVADSHTNALLRTKWVLAEQGTTIKAYNQTAWANQPDYRLPIGPALAFLHAVHERWLALVRAYAPADLAVPYFHPENGPMRLDRTLGQYAWHGAHHTAHITRLRERMGW